jgi:N-acetylglucosaminyl-diphospho-decaprenol L-rhamnosyltransferase
MAQHAAVVDAVVVTTNAREMALQCVEHLVDPSLARVIVVDNGSSDGVAEALVAEYPHVVVVRIEQTGGLAHAFNRGAEAGEAAQVLFLNDDIIVEPRAITLLAESLENDAGAVAAAGRLVDAHTGETQEAYLPRPFPTATTITATLLGLERVWPHNPWTGPDDRLRTASAPVAAEHVAGACVLIRRPVYEAVGRWDEGYSLWYEDVDISKRLSERGRILFVPGAVFRHFGGYTAKQFSDAAAATRFFHGIVHYSSVHLARPSRLAVAGVVAAIAGTRAFVRRSARPEWKAAHRKILGEARELARSAWTGDRA